MIDTLLILVSLSITVILGIVKFSDWGRKQDIRIKSALDDFEVRNQNIPQGWVSAAIVLSSAATLFLELSMIRIQGGYVQVLALLKNISLLSCFLGLGVGFVLRRSRGFSLPLLPILLLFQVGFLKCLYATDAYKSLGNPFADEGMVGLASVSGFDSALVLMVVVGIFTLNALTFAPLGALSGNLMERMEGTKGYRYNLIGSILGICLFNMLSFMWLGGAFWLGVFTLLMAPFFMSWNIVSMTSMALLAGAVFVVDHSSQLLVRRIYSPYQTIELINSAQGGGELSSNSLYYQRIIDLSDSAVVDSQKAAERRRYYDLPFRLLGSAESVLVVGSGTGNDIAAALRSNVQRVKAVEIDPVILKIGESYHPERPYSSTRVDAEITDARAFIKRSKERFDGIIYGLLDSHALLSGRNSGLRLDSYVYTVEAFREARSLLKDRGLLVLSFVDMSRETGKKLFLMLCEAFDGQEPTVVRTAYDSSITFIAGRALSDSERLALGDFSEVGVELSDPEIGADISSDDWPYFYMPRKVYPLSYLWLWVPLLLISVALFRPALKRRNMNFDWCAFFLGASFMLIETKAFTELALVWGSTFAVTTFVLLFVLVLGIISNEIVLRKVKISNGVSFGLLFISLIAGYGLTFLSLAGIPLWAEGAVRGVIITLPLLFAGICFSSRLERGKDVSGTMAANLLGAIFGGILEYTSMVSGFRFLYVIAFVIYGLAFLSLRIAFKRE